MKDLRIDLNRARIAVEVTSVCNLRCGMCPLKTMERGMRHMDLGLLREIHRQIREAGLSVRYLHEMGEPLLYPHIYEALALFPEVTLSTHGNGLNEETVKKILSTPPAVIRICLDTVNPDLYPSIRTGGSFEKVVANTRRFLEMAHSSPIRIEIQRMVTTLTIDESKRDFIRLFNLQHYPNAAVIEKTCEGLDTTDATPLHGVYAGCFQGGPFNWFVILADGSVTHCCYDYEGKQVIGNLRDSTLLEIASSPKLEEIRDAFKRRDFSNLPQCAECFKHAGEVAVRPPWFYNLIRRIPFKDCLRRLFFRRSSW